MESFTYNLQNQLTGYQSSNKKASYAYGADGLRKSKTVNNVMMKYVWDRGNLAAEVSGSTIVNMYDYGQDGITSKETSNGDKTLYLKNAHGDVVGMSDTSGNVSANYQYDAFGNIMSETSPDPFGYCGEYLDSESGLIYLRNRYYDSSTGRFITEDPAKDGVNWYSYCAGNPVTFVDPWGLEAGDPFKTIDEAAIDFGQEYYSTTDYTMLELGTLIYSFVDEEGNEMYSYVKPIIGDAHSVAILDVEEDLPSGSEVVAGIHQHPNTSSLSNVDKYWAEYRSMPLYLVIPGNTLIVWDHALDKEGNVVIDETGKEVWQTRTVSSNLKLRGLSIAEKIALQYTYSNVWSAHIEGGCPYGCNNRIWPRTEDGIQESWNVTESEFIYNWMNKVLCERYKQ